MAQNSSFSELDGYVDIHGRDIKVFVCEKTGEILIPIDEARKTGFNIYRKTQYNKLLVDDNQFSKEFNLFMLQSAQTYLLSTKLVFKELDILESINNCRKLLTDHPTDSISVRPKTPTKNFMKNHVIESNDEANISITSTVSEPKMVSSSQMSDRKFKGFNPKRSPGSALDSYKNGSPENKSEESRHNPRISMDAKPQNTTFEKRNVKFPENNHFNRDKKNFENSKNRSPNFNNRSTPNADSRNGEFGSSSNLSVQSEGDQTELKKLACICFTKPQHSVLVTCIETGPCMWVQDVDNVDTLVNIDEQIQQDVSKYKVCKSFGLETCYLAQYEDSWYRCKIIKFKPQKCVFFIDYGNTATLTDNDVILNVSDELAAIPCQAARITMQAKPTLFDTITIKINKRFDNLTYSVDIVNEMDSKTLSPTTSVEQKPVIPTYFKKPQPLCKLEDGQRVMVVGQMEGKLALRTKECYDKLKQVELAIEEAQTESVDHVSKMQVVLVTKDGAVQRGIVTNIQGTSVDVDLLDYFETTKVKMGAIRHTTKSLSLEPLTYVVSPSVALLDESAKKFVDDLIQNRAKCNVVLNGVNFDLKLTDKLLSEALKLSNVPMLKDWPVCKIDLGVDSYIVSSFRTVDDVTLIPPEDMSTYIEDILISELDDDRSYKPKTGEVCYGFYQDNWSRGVVLREVNGRYEIKFVDFGNLEFLRPEQLRKLSENAKKIPILGIPCRLQGVPRIPNAEGVLKDIIEPYESYNVNVTKRDGEVYVVELPELYEKMKTA